MTELKWLNAFARLNTIACERALRKMAKNYLVERKNMLEAQLLVRAKYIGQEFYHSPVEIGKLRDEIIEFYAEMFTKGKKEKAKKILEEKKEFVRTQEIT